MLYLYENFQSWFGLYYTMSGKLCFPSTSISHFFLCWPYPMFPPPLWRDSYENQIKTENFRRGTTYISFYTILIEPTFYGLYLLFVFVYLDLRNVQSLYWCHFPSPSFFY